MSEYGKVSAHGQMAEGDGQTTEVRLPRLPLDPKDKAVLCAQICACNQSPDVSTSGGKLKQQCVSKRLAARDQQMGGRSVYKPEINYDMSKTPPEPITLSKDPMTPHPFLPAWIEKYWPGGLSQYESGVGNIRRPDCVIVKDPSVPATQDNIKTVVEMKFPPDRPSTMQRALDRRIAGRNAGAVVMGPEDCDCSHTQPETAPQTSEATDSSPSALFDQFKALLNRGVPSVPGGGLPLPPVPFPVP
ncbi:VRR-NUC domain-containing protein [Paraburkholderia sp. DD10]|uniref:VRR-NUC domain-containing protein n=1 Tax=Paraburkholderia sp. DD10 TaxID=3409691 RepID=UPI003BA38B0B